MNRVRILRNELRFNQQHLAELVGVKQGNFSRMENGKLTLNNTKEIEEKAIKILKPLLLKKLIEAQSEVERLESLVIQYK